MMKTYKFPLTFSTKLLAPTLLLGLATAAQGSLFDYQAILTGPNESPPNASPATGFAEAIYNDTAHTLSIHVTFSGLTGPTTASHIHAPTLIPGTGTADVATTTPYFTGFPIGVTSGTYDGLLDLTQTSSYKMAFITANGGTTSGAETALAAALAADEAYLNIHCQTFPSGEIRGFLVLVPEPSSMALLGLGVAALWLRRRQTT